MSVFGRGLARDELNQSWDLAVTGGVSGTLPSGQDDLGLLLRFQALDAAPAPDAHFVERLGQQLAFVAQSQPQTLPQSASVPRTPSPKPLSVPPARTPGSHRWASMAAALLLLLAAASGLWLTQRQQQPEDRSIPAVAVDATPATPSAGSPSGTLLHATFDPASIGVTGQETWTTSGENLVTLPAGESYAHDGAESGDTGFAVVIVLTGAFDAVSSGPTLLYRAGDSAGRQITANESISLAEGDAWIASMADRATASNTSGAAAEILRYAIGIPGDDYFFLFSPSGKSVFAHDPMADEVSTGPLTIDVQRVHLAQHDTHPIEVREGESFLLLTAETETLRIAKDGSNRGASTNATSLGDYPPGNYTIIRDLSGEGDLYLARLAAEGSDTPSLDTATSSSVIETLLRATIDPATLGVTVKGTSTVALEYVLEIPAGRTYAQRGGDNGISVVIVLTGTFEAMSSGSSLVFQDGDRSGREVSPYTTLALSEGDVWIASAEDVATAANTAEEQSDLLRYVFGMPTDGDYFYFSPSGGYPFAHETDGPAWPSGPITIDVQGISLDKGDTYPVMVKGDESYLLVTSGTGAVNITEDGSNPGSSTTATSLGDYPAGAYTISRDLSSPVDVYLASWTSADTSESSTTLGAEAPAIETLLNATVDPEAIAAGPATAWDYSGVFPKQGLHPGQSIVLDAANWGAGLTVTKVLEGELALETEGPAQIIRAGSTSQEMVPAGSSIALATGDAVMLDASHGAEFRNDSEADVSLYTFAAFDVPDQFFPDVPFPENLWGPLTPTVDPDLTQQFDGPVTVSIQRTTLVRDQAISVDVGENELVYFDTDDGSPVHFQEADSDRPIPGSRIVLHDKGTGTYTLTRLRDDPVEITIVRLRAAEASAQSNVQREQLADLTFDPALLGADATQSWTLIDQFTVEIGAGETLEIGGDDFAGGFFVTFPLSGSVEITTSRDALWSASIGAELQPVAAGANQTIAPGQLWAGATGSPIEIANNTDASTSFFVFCLCSSTSRPMGGSSIGSDHQTIARNEDPDSQFVYAGDPVTISVERIVLDSEAQYDFELGANETILVMTGDRSLMRVTGDQNQAGVSSNQRVLHGTDEPQTYTIFRDIGGPVDIYIVHVSVPPANDPPS